MNNKQNVSRSNTVIYGILFVVFGILLVIISAYIDQAYSDEHNNKNSSASVTQSGVAQQNNSGLAQPNNASQNVVLQQQKQSPFINITASALSTIGVAFVGFGIFSILLDLKSWREYFSERLRPLIIESEE